MTDELPSLPLPEALLAELRTLRATVTHEGQDLLAIWQPQIARRGFVPGAANLAAYLALRRHDLRAIQVSLTRWGLSSLGRLESRVLPTLNAVVAALTRITQANPADAPFPDEAAFFSGALTLRDTTAAIFGQPSGPRRTRIMVTLPSEAATDLTHTRELVRRGVECVRINCAHDDAEAWAAMIAHLRAAEREAERSTPTKILMDLAGPKIRTMTPKDKPLKQRLMVGDQLLLTDDLAAKEKDGPPQIGCTLAAALPQLRPGAEVWIDDGKLGLIVRSVSAAGALLSVTDAPAKGFKLKPEKGINFPTTDLNVVPLTDKDYADLDFVAQHADMVGYSFVQQAEDVTLLIEELRARATAERPSPALVLKIETRRAVRNLPDMIVRAAGALPTAVMIARGDLAVELGYQRTAEIQEEMLWLCEAAHVPVIWATQVLESLAKDGVPTRGDVTDAAMGSRAECVMLNKGPYIVDVVELLDDVLRRMEAHQNKKTPQLRALRAWDSLFEDIGA